MIRNLILLNLVSVILLSCAGYRFSHRENPLGHYRISSVSIPMFLNRSVLPNLSGPLTKEITLLLTGYPSLKVYTGDDARADAILLGIITSEKNVNSVIQTTQTKVIFDGELKDSIGSRGKFSVPTQSSYSIKLQMILIRDPTIGDIALMTSELAANAEIRHPKVIFNAVLPLSTSFSRIVAANTESSGAGPVNFTKTNALFEKSEKELAKVAAQTFKEEVLDAF